MGNKRVAIVGGGLTGLSAAVVLQSRGIEQELFEHREEVGGAIRSESQDGWLLEYGPNTLLLKENDIADFLEQAGCGSLLVQANEESSKRFVVRNGRLMPVPMSPVSLIKSPLFSTGAKLRLLSEPFRGRTDAPDPTVAQFVEKRLGPEILDYAVNPFVAGIYAGNPSQLSLRHTFPILHDLQQESPSLFIAGIKRALFKKQKSDQKRPRQLVSFKGGIQQLAATLAASAGRVHTGTSVTGIRKTLDGWQLQTPVGEREGFTDVLVTIPLHKWSRDLVPATDAEMESIQSVQYPPLSVMHLGFRKQDVEHPLDGFGFLVPEAENRHVLGALFSSTLFEGRAPDGHHLLTVFIGGARQPKLAQLESDRLFPIVMDELRDLIGVKDEPTLKEHVFWPQSIPQYHIGYDEVLQLFDQIEEREAGFHIAGNFRHGVSLPDCIRHGIRAAESIAGS
ncbi:MAG: protoporphyrinogen oxidase [Balneolaceae bacterium]